MVIGQWSMVNGQWSMVNGQWSMVLVIVIQSKFELVLNVFYIIVKFKCTTRLLKVNYKHSKWHRFVKVMIIGTYSTTQFLKVVNIQQGPMYMESASENRNDAQNVKK